MSDVQSIKKQLHMQQWTAIIEDRIASGLKIDEYCEKNQLSRNSYFTGCERFGKRCQLQFFLTIMIYYLHPYPQKLWLSWFQVQTIMIPSPKSRSQMKKRKVLAFPLTESALLLVTIYRKNCFPKS